MPQILVAFLMVTATIVMHLAGLLALMWILRRPPIFPRLRALHNHLLSFLIVAWGLVFLHATEIWAWATLFHRLGAVPNFETAIFFSTATYATIGGGVVVLPVEWRVLGAIEGAMGMLLLGWSTAFFISVVNRMNLIHGRDASPLERPGTGRD